jgi:hypothetical protein
VDARRWRVRQCDADVDDGKRALNRAREYGYRSSTRGQAAEHLACHCCGISRYTACADTVIGRKHRDRWHERTWNITTLPRSEPTGQFFQTSE